MLRWGMEGAATFITPNCVQYERMVLAPVNAVWPLIGTPEGLARCFIPDVRFRPGLGASFYLMEGWEGTISLYRPERVISFFPDEGGETTFECIPIDAQSCTFRLTDRQAPGFVPPPDIPMDPAAPRDTGLISPAGRVPHGLVYWWAGIILQMIWWQPQREQSCPAKNVHRCRVCTISMRSG